jgi:hypothetical protein
MIRQEHITKMKLLGAMLGDASAGLTAVAIKAGLDYAQRLTTDTALQADVKATFKQDLAARDIKRAAQVVEKYGNAKESVKSVPGAIPVPAPKRSEFKLQEFLAHGIVVPSGPERYAYTWKGEAWKDAGKPPLETFSFTPPSPPPPPPPKEIDLTPIIPYLDISYGYITFGRVPDDMRRIDGKPIRDLFISAGIIDAKLFVTERGKAWLAQSSNASGQVAGDNVPSGL